MARPKGSIKTPTYRLHKATGQAVVTIDGKSYYLGKHDGEDSKRKYERMIGEWLLRGKQGPMAANAQTVTVVQLVGGYLEYRKEEFGFVCQRVRTSMAWLVEHYGDKRVADFGPLCLKAIREKMIKSKCWVGMIKTERTLSRRYINNLTGAIVGAFKWGCSVEMVPSNIYHALLSVGILKAGRSAAAPGRKIAPVDDVHIDAVLRVANPTVAAMIKLQLLTGARPGEICAMRMIDIDCTARVWKYRPSQHKNLHRGQDRVIFVGPQAQEIIKQFCTLDLNAHVFNPRRTFEEKYRRVRATAKDVRSWHKMTAPKHCRDHYCTSAYNKSVATYCKMADRLAHEQRPNVAAEVKIVPHWHPHQLRHNAATYLRKEFGIEVARVVLGHRTAGVTEIYAEADQTKAAEAMTKVG